MIIIKSLLVLVMSSGIISISPNCIPFQLKYQNLSGIQDSLPALHTIKESDLKNVESSFEEGTITITLQDGIIYKYNEADWDYQDYFPDLNSKLKAAVQSVKKTFTKAEHEPQFPGGQEAWNQYVHNFCLSHSKIIAQHGNTDITLQFIVHIHGQITDIETVSVGNGDSKLIALAIQCIKDAPSWTCATQNGHQVPCYKKQVISLFL
jgi:hypothetical protein